MRAGTAGFVGQRLKEAREARGLTQISLSEMLGVSNRAISQYEKGLGTPHPDIMQKIPAILNIPMAYFLAPIKSNENIQEPVFYRSMSSATAMARVRGENRYKWLKKIATYLEEFIEFPKENFPDSKYSDDPLKITQADIEEAASELRKFWGLGDGPISNVTFLLENNGAIVSRMSLGADTLDAFSNWNNIDNRPYIILSPDKWSAARSRLDAGHELAHIILHRRIPIDLLRNTPKFKIMESQAFKFAGSFLLPATSFSEDFFIPTLDALITLKNKWNVSIGAMIMRAKDLDLINDEQSSRLWRYYARRGYKKKEPLDDVVEPEKPELLKQAMTLLVEENIQSRIQILSELSLNELDIEEIVGLPSGFFDCKPKVKTISKVVPINKSRNT